VLTAFAAGAIFLGWFTATPKLADAYTISTIITAGCHENVTTDAFRAVRLDPATAATAAPLPADRNDRALIDDLEFAPANDMTDLGGATLLIGVRDNDLKGRDSMDLSQLPLVHGDPGAQREHCLRNAHEQEPGGSEAAVLDCRAFIRERVAQALDGLDATTGKPDPTNKTSLPLYLALRHHVDALLPTYYVRIGQAIHAVEDSFTHTYRTLDGTKSEITVVMDWVDEANGNLVEATDGPPHSSEMDRCDDPDDLRTQRRALATEAATAVLRTTLDPNQTNEQKTAAVEVILDKYLSYSPGCTFDNNWCEAPEHKYGNGSLGCSMGGPGNRSSGWEWAAILGLVALLGRSRRRRGRGAMVGMALLSIASLLPSHAFAQPEASPPSSDAAPATETHTPPPPVTTPVKEPGPKDPSQMALGAYLGGSGSATYAAAAATLGARLRFSRHWTFGLDAEWNPWIAINGRTALRAGSFNGYGTVILRLPLAYEKFNLRTTANLGLSRLLIDLYGVPKGSMGLYAGLSPLGLEWKMSRLFFLVINPLNFAMPTPKLSGVPFSYYQYRFTIGLEVYGG
jgi:MYXO-CTERM domain-containing protein